MSIADYPGTTTPITTDQRGEPLDSPNPDIGAFQTQGSTLTPLSFSGISDQSITYGTSSVTVSGTLADGSQAPVGETVAVTLDGDEQSATIGSGGAFSTTFDTTGLSRGRLALHDQLCVHQRRDLRLRQHHQHADGQPGDAHHHGEPRDQGLWHRRPGAGLHRQRLPVQRHRRVGPDRRPARAQAGTLAGEQAGGYAISQGTLAADSNYTISFTGNTLTITPAPLTVTANPQTKVYGTDDPALTDTATGFVDTTVDGVTIDDTAATALSGQLARTVRRDGIRRPLCDHPGHARGEQLHRSPSPAAR